MFVMLKIENKHFGHGWPFCSFGYSAKFQRIRLPTRFLKCLTLFLEFQTRKDKIGGVSRIADC